MERKSDCSVRLLGAAVLMAAMLVLCACAGRELRLSFVYHPEVGDDPSCGKCHEDKNQHDHTEEWKAYNIGHMKLEKKMRGDCVICHGEIDECGFNCHMNR